MVNFRSAWVSQTSYYWRQFGVHRSIGYFCTFIKITKHYKYNINFYININDFYVNIILKNVV